MKYQRDLADNSIFARQVHSGTGDIIEFRAKDVQNKIDGKSTISVYHEPYGETERLVLGSHRFNIHDMVMRTRLGNSTYRNIHNGLKEQFTDKNMVAWVFQFTADLVDFDSSAVTSELVPGNPDWRVQFLAYPHLVDGCMSVLSARGASTKSYTGIAMAISIDSGVDKLWPIEVVAPALYINMERSKASIAGRIGWVNEALGLEGSRPLEVLHTQGRSFHQIETALRRIVAEKGIQFAVLDSLSRTKVGDLTENSPANMVMDLMSDLFHSSLVIAHSPKHSDTPGEIFGSDMYRNAADVTIGVTAHREDGSSTTYSEFEIEKANDIGVRSKSWLAFEFADDPNPDPRIKISRLVDIRVPRYDELPDFDGDKATEEDRVYTYLVKKHNTKNSTATTPEISRDLDIPQSNLRRILNSEKGKKKFVQMEANGKLSWGLLSSRNTE